MRPLQHFIAALFVTLAAACAADDVPPGVLIMLGAPDVPSNAQSCCATLAAALSHPMAMRHPEGSSLGKTFVVFDQSSPHFDFDSGMVPFAVLPLPRGVNMLGTESLIISPGSAYGEKWALRYVDVRVLFVDAQQQLLPSAVVSCSRSAARDGIPLLLRLHRIPPGAVQAVVTTHRRRQGNDPSCWFNNQLTAWPHFLPAGARSSSYGSLNVQPLALELTKSWP